MATKKKRTTTSRSRSTQSKKSTSLINRLFSSKRNIVYLIIGLVGLVGVLALLSTSAATQSPAPNNNAPQRFPGDPNPRVSGKSYLGTSYSGGDPAPKYEKPIGKSLPLHRIFIGGWGSRESGVTKAKEAVAKNRLPAVSFKTADWNEMASGKHDAEIDSLLRGLDSAGGPVWMIIWHEPDACKSSNCGPLKTDQSGGPAAWRAMQAKFRQRMETVKTKNVAFMPTITAYSWQNTNPGRSTEADWWVPGNYAGGSVWDAYFVDYYTVGASSIPEQGKQWTEFVKWAEARKIPFGIMEWNNKDETEARRGLELKNFWNWIFSNNKDMVALTQWDSNVDGAQYVVNGSQLAAFLDVTKNDPRIQRIDDLGRGGIVPAPTPSPTPTPTPTPNNETTINITSPAANATVSGIVTVRVDASDSDGIGSVNFRINDKWQASDDTAPYEWKNWDTTKLSDGTHQIVVRVRDRLGNMTEKSISVKTQNNSANTGVLQPPQNLTASLGSFNFGNFIANKVPYEINLNWSNAAAYSYDVVRSGQFIGATNGTAFTDKSGLQLGQTYYYEVTSKDGKGGKSTSTSTSVNVTCALFWCNLQTQ